MDRINAKGQCDRVDDRHHQHQYGNARQEHGQEQQNDHQKPKECDRVQTHSGNPLGDVLRPALIGQQKLEDANAAQHKEQDRGQVHGTLGRSVCLFEEIATQRDCTIGKGVGTGRGTRLRRC